MATATIMWEDQITDPKEREVFAALADLRWDFRTVPSIARDTELTEQEVREILERHPELVRRPIVPDPSGRELFTLRERPMKLQERLAWLRVLVTKSIY